MTTEEHVQLDADPDEGDSGNSRVRSKIAFPYTPLADAEQVAQALHRRGGTASLDELAAELNQVITSGAFRTKVATARTFGAASVRRGQANLTPLGRRLVDPTNVEQARSEAFLTVPLYRKIYDEFKGHTLPGTDGLENTMARFGVSPKQTERARQAFQRSAEQAGYFRHGSDRLVSPAVSETPPEVEKKGRKKQAEGILPPAVEALMIQLLEDGQGWTPEQTEEFVKAARTIYKLS